MMSHLLTSILSDGNWYRDPRKSAIVLAKAIVELSKRKGLIACHFGSGHLKSMELFRSFLDVMPIISGINLPQAPRDKDNIEPQVYVGTSKHRILYFFPALQVSGL